MKVTGESYPPTSYVPSAVVNHLMMNGSDEDDSAYAVSSSSSKVLSEYPCRDRPSLCGGIGEEEKNGREDVIGEEGGRLRNGVQEQTTDDVHYFRITTNILHFRFSFHQHVLYHFNIVSIRMSSQSQKLSAAAVVILEEGHFYLLHLLMEIFIFGLTDVFLGIMLVLLFTFLQKKRLSPTSEEYI